MAIGVQTVTLADKSAFDTWIAANPNAHILHQSSDGTDIVVTFTVPQLPATGKMRDRVNTESTYNELGS